VRILFLETEAITGEVRLRPLLDQLIRASQIEAYAVVDRDMTVLPKKLAQYDVALTHRIPNARQIEWLKRHRPPMVYDIDDLLLRADAEALARRERNELERLDWCLRHADAVTSPSSRLLTTLARRHGDDLQGRAHRLPNCGREAPAAPRSDGRPSLLWASSSAHRWSDELRAIAEGVAVAARDARIDVHLVGRFPAALVEVFSNPKLHPDWTPFPAFMDWLENAPLVAVAPLAGGLGGEEQALLDCKSDIKAAQYGSSRIAAAFSAAPPYYESDLPRRLVPANDAEEWRRATAALIEDYPRRGNEIGDDPAFLGRRPSVVAATLLKVLEAARQGRERPFSFRAIPTPRLGRAIEQRLRAAWGRLRPDKPNP
jgi:hypothetical protein